VYRRSVDTRAIATLAARPDTLARAAAIRDRLGRPRSVLLSLDTDDDMEAAHRRLAALSTLYSEHGCRPEDVSVIQVMTCAARPGATDGTGAVAREVARINGLYGAVGRTPVHYLQSAPDLAERVALYLAADLLVATPLRQVTSLAALEYVAAGPPTGGLVLSEFGATAQVLPGAWMVNPFQPHEVATTIRAATAAAPDERRCRIAAMRRYVAGYDHRIWLETFAGAVRRRSGGTDAPTRRAADRPSRRPASAILTAGPR
jgi:trehalose 6-phosphate synthase